MHENELHEINDRILSVTEAGIDWLVTRHGCGWFDGGCATLAIAVSNWLRTTGKATTTELRAIGRSRLQGNLDHVVCVVDDRWVVDGLGVTPIDQYTTRFAFIEAREPVRFTARNLTTVAIHDAGIPIFADGVIKLASMLNNRALEAA